MMSWRYAVFACAMVLTAVPVFGTVVVYTRELPHSIEDEFNDEPAAFGAKLPAEGLRGLLVKGNPVDGCTALARMPPESNEFDKWIVLISRYNCTFEVKIRNAQAAGFDAVIVHNVNSSELDTMTAKQPFGIDIPSVFVTDLTGLELEESYLYDSGYYVMLNGPPTRGGNLTLLIGIIVAVLVIFIVCFYFIVMRSMAVKRCVEARRAQIPWRSLCELPSLGAGAGKENTAMPVYPTLKDSQLA